MASIQMSIDCLWISNVPFKYMLYDNGWNCFKHVFVKVTRMLSFLSREDWGTLQEEAALLRSLAIVWSISGVAMRTSGGTWPQSPTQKALSLRDSAAPAWPGDHLPPALSIHIFCAQGFLLALAP